MTAVAAWSCVVVVVRRATSWSSARASGHRAASLLRCISSRRQCSSNGSGKRVGEAVEDDAAVLAVLHEPGGAQHAERVPDRVLARVGGERDVADAELVDEVQRVQDPQPHRIGEQREQAAEARGVVGRQALLAGPGRPGRRRRDVRGRLAYPYDRTDIQDVQGCSYRVWSSRAARPARSDELLEQFTLTHAADRPVKTYSGGMRRRLDLAASLLGEPEILFLDEPTTGLDPTGRSRTWDIIRDLIDGGTTILLTTQYLEEADILADRIVVVDGGRAIAEGTSDELKAMVGTNHVEVTISSGSSFDEARRVLESHAPGTIYVDESARLLSMPAQSDEPGLVTTVIGALAASGVLVDALDVRRPSLDDVFLELTGHTAEQAPPDVEEEAA